jgi:APA family basic amino acid/polyamine antiporter
MVARRNAPQEHSCRRFVVRSESSNYETASARMTQLARKLRFTDYFTLAFGTMVGVGWLVVMDDWLGRGGPVGAILGFAIGGAALLPIGYVYGRLVMRQPDAAGEVAYTSVVFPEPLCYATGWMMLLAYAIVCPWETVAIGRIAAYIFPALDSFELYRLGGQPVYLPHLALGLGLTALLVVLNYRGIRLSATFQNITTFGLLLLFAVFGGFSLTHGSVRNLSPAFSRAPLAAVLLVIQIVPYFMTGFESISKASEEARQEFRSRDYLRATMLAIVVGIIFYTGVVAVVAVAQPWQSIVREKFATAVALERVAHSRWIVNVVLAAALLSLGKVFNGNFVAATRLLFALGRRGMMDARLARVHPVNQTPAAAILAVGAVTAAATLLGGAILIPITEVGSLASAFGWMMACAAYFAIRPGSAQRATALLGIAVAATLALMKFLPIVPGHFSRFEYAALAVWVLLGLLLHRRPAISST